MEITYSRIGDYLLPDIILSEPSPELTEPLGRYGRMRRTFLKEHRTAFYNTLLLSERLFPNLHELDETASILLDKIIADILIFNPPPEKALDGLAWAAHMTEIKQAAEHMILDKIVYA